MASVPANHVYVRHLDDDLGGLTEGASLEMATVKRLSDARPSGPVTSPEQWWPPRMLSPDWIARHDFDIFHLHFGFDAVSSVDLKEVVSALRRRRKPLVYTVHDLRNPHHHDSGAHDAALNVLIPAADALITLTPGAATRIQQRWGRTARVIPHPHVVDFATMERASTERARRPTAPFRVGLHCKSMRAGMNPLTVLPTLARTIAELPDAVLQVNAHRDVFDAGPRQHRSLVALLTELVRAGVAELAVHDYLNDAALWRYLADLDVSVLPYRFGTHSGWLEACRDLGTTVVAPSCGYYRDQGPVLSYGHDESHVDLETLTQAIRTAYADRPQLGASVKERREQRRRIARAHQSVYAALVS